MGFFVVVVLRYISTVMIRRSISFMLAGAMIAASFDLWISLDVTRIPIVGIGVIADGVIGALWLLEELGNSNWLTDQRSGSIERR
jgi:hypothetical protein